MRCLKCHRDVEGKVVDGGILTDTVECPMCGNRQNEATGLGSALRVAGPALMLVSLVIGLPTDPNLANIPPWAKY